MTKRFDEYGPYGENNPPVGVRPLDAEERQRAKEREEANRWNPDAEVFCKDSNLDFQYDCSEGETIYRVNVVTSLPGKSETFFVMGGEKYIPLSQAHKMVEEEREACAKDAEAFCWNRSQQGPLKSPAVFTSHTWQDIGAAIRTRTAKK